MSRPRTTDGTSPKPTTSENNKTSTRDRVTRVSSPQRGTGALTAPPSQASLLGWHASQPVPTWGPSLGVGSRVEGMPASNAKRQELIVTALSEAFEPLMRADPDGFRTKFRKMAADPFAFYRGSACLFYADMAQRSRGRDQRDDDRTGRVWIHGDLHAENFGTYMNSEGVLVFDVNDFDEAYLGHFSWDLRRFLASLALMGWQKALPEEDIRRAVADLPRGVRRPGAALRQGRGGRGVRAAPRQHRGRGPAGAA